MKFKTYLHFNGTCRKAIDYYVKSFGLKKPKSILTYGDMPEGAPKEIKKLIAFAHLDIGGQGVMFSDTPDGKGHITGNNISLCIDCKNKKEVMKIFTKMKRGSAVHDAPQKTSWNECYTMFTDKFGITWILSVEGYEK